MEPTTTTTVMQQMMFSRTYINPGVSNGVLIWSVIFAVAVGVVLGLTVCRWHHARRAPLP